MTDTGLEIAKCFGTCSGRMFPRPTRLWWALSSLSSHTAWYLMCSARMQLQQPQMCDATSPSLTGSWGPDPNCPIRWCSQRNGFELDSNHLPCLSSLHSAPLTSDTRASPSPARIMHVSQGKDSYRFRAVDSPSVDSNLPSACATRSRNQRWSSAGHAATGRLCAAWLMEERVTPRQSTRGREGDANSDGHERSRFR